MTAISPPSSLPDSPVNISVASSTFLPKRTAKSFSLDAFVMPLGYKVHETRVVLLAFGRYKAITLPASDMAELESAFRKAFPEVDNGYPRGNFGTLRLTDTTNGNSFILTDAKDVKSDCIIELVQDRLMEKFIYAGEVSTRQKLTCINMIIVYICLALITILGIIALSLVHGSVFLAVFNAYTAAQTNVETVSALDSFPDTLKFKDVKTKGLRVDKLLTVNPSATRFSSSRSSYVSRAIASSQHAIYGNEMTATGDFFKVDSQNGLVGVKGTFLATDSVIVEATKALNMQSTAGHDLLLVVPTSTTSNRELIFPDCSGTLITTCNVEMITTVGQLQNVTVLGQTIMSGGNALFHDVEVTASAPQLHLTYSKLHLGASTPTSLNISSNMTQNGAHFALPAKSIALGQSSAQSVEMRGSIVSHLDLLNPTSSSFKTTLRPSGPTTVHSIIDIPTDVSGTVITTGNLNDVDFVPSTSSMVIQGNLVVDQSLRVDGATTLSGTTHLGDAGTDTLTVKAATSFTAGTLQFGNEASDTVTFSGAATWNGPLWLMGSSPTDQLRIPAAASLTGDVTLGSSGTKSVSVTSELVGSLRFSGTTPGGNIISLTSAATPASSITMTLPDVSGTLITTGNLADITSTGTLTALTISGALISNAGTVTAGTGTTDLTTVAATCTFSAATATVGDSAADVTTVSAPTTSITSATITLGDDTTDALTIKAALAGGLLFTGSTLGGNVVSLKGKAGGSATSTLPNGVSGELVTDTNLVAKIAALTTTPTLTVSGTITAAKYTLTGDGITPEGMVSYFNLAACPAGWSQLPNSAGRIIVGAAAGWSIPGVGGTALSDQEVPKHSHAFTFSPPITSTSESQAHSHYNTPYDTNWGSTNPYSNYGCCSGLYPRHYHSYGNNQQSHTHTVDMGTVTSVTTTSDYSYIQYIICVKDAN